MNKKDKSWGIIIGLSLSIFLINITAYAWTRPTQAPPLGNVSPPLNISANPQVKRGALGIEGVLRAFSNLIVDGRVGIGTRSPAHRLHVAGNVGANAFFYLSDVALKTNIMPLNNSLAKILRLRGVSFNWKENNEPSIGLIAQDVEKIFPEMVIKDSEKGIRSVDYAKMIVPLIEAIKEQQTQIEELKDRIKKLELHKD